MRSIITIAIILTALSLQAQVVPNATNADNVDGVSGAAINQDIAALHVATATERSERIAGDDYLSHAYAINFPSNTASSYQTLQDWINITQSAGRIERSSFTNNGDGTIKVSAGSGIFKATNSATAQVTFADWSEDGSVSLTDEALNYVYATYTDGVITIDADNVVANINGNNEIILGIVYRQGTGLDILEYSALAVNPEIKDYNRVVLRGIERMTGGIVAEVATSSISSTAGLFYTGKTDVNTPSKDTSGSDTFTYYSRLGGGNWSKVTGRNMIDNENYDNGTSTTPLTTNRFGVHWVYICLEGDLYVVYGQGNYTLSLAENAVSPATLPDYLDKFAILASKIIIQKGDTTFTSIVTAYETLFPVTSPPNHDDLGNLSYALAKHTGFASEAQMDEVHIATAAERTARINQDILIGQATGQEEVARTNQDTLIGQATGHLETAVDLLEKNTGYLQIAVELLEDNTGYLESQINRPMTLVVGFTQDCDYICSGDDDYVEAQQAADALKLFGGGVVLLREGIYDFDSDIGANLQTEVSSTTFMGVGNATIIVSGGDAIGILLRNSNCKIMNLQFTTKAGLSGGIVTITSRTCTMQDCLFQITDQLSTSVISVGGEKTRIINNRFENTNLAGNETVIEISDADNSYIGFNYIQSSADGIDVSDSDDTMIMGNRIIAVDGIIFSHANATRTMVFGNDFEGCTNDISDAVDGTNIHIRHNLDLNGAWLAETEDFDMGGNSIVNIAEAELTNGATIARQLKVKQITSGDAGSTNDVYTRFVSSDSWGVPLAGETGPVATVYHSISFTIPGHLYETADIQSIGQLGYDFTISSVIVSVNRGTPPEGSPTNFDIIISTVEGEGGVYPYGDSIFASTFTCQLTAGTTVAIVTTFREASIKKNWELYLSIGETPAATGDPTKVTVQYKQD